MRPPPCRWSPTQGVLDSPVLQYNYRGVFVPGKDVRVAEQGKRYSLSSWTNQKQPRTCGRGKPADERNRTTLLWEGAVKHLTEEQAARGETMFHNSRALLVDKFRGHPGFALRDTWVTNPDGTRGQNRTEGLDWDYNVRPRDESSV